MQAKLPSNCPDPVSFLDRSDKNWRDNLPLLLGDEQAKRFVQGLVADAVEIVGSDIGELPVVSACRDAATEPTASGDDDGLLADLVFGPRAHFVVHDETLATLEDPKIDRRLLSSMNQNGPERFGRDWHPYRHQVQAWRALAQPEPRSVVVCSGTGSGKTD